jgi:amino acid transporter
MSKKQHTKLGEIPSTAICANDILSSVLYVSGLVIPVAGIFAPVVMLFVGLILFLYKGVYREVVEAMPVNGGCYNALLNATSKNWAALAGVLTILSYAATAVISAKSGVDYLFSLDALSSKVSGFGLQNVILIGTICVLVFFALLVISGVKDSAKVAIGIFSFHVLTLVSLIGFCVTYLFLNPSINYFAKNITHTEDIVQNIANITRQGPVLSFALLLFLGLGTSLLGVSGFESSANFVEEQERGVFAKTLRNMMLGVTIFNPSIALLFLFIFPIETIHENASYILSVAAEKVGGPILQYGLVIDAFLVLCGAVLTAFVGICGLVSRMSLDGCVPKTFADMNSKESFPKIIWGFLALCVSILLVSKGDIPTLGGIYAISFLSVMCMFALANLILKVTRPNLKRTYRTKTILALFALAGTTIGLIANIVARDGHLGDFANSGYFLQYFVPLYFLVSLFVYRDYIIGFLVQYFRFKWLLKIWNTVSKEKYVAFIHDPKTLYSILSYIDKNESGKKVVIVNCDDKDDPMNDEYSEEIADIVPSLRHAGVFYPHLEISLHFENGKFGPHMVDRVSHKLRVPKNNIFIGSIHDHHDFDYDELGGVRIVMA